MINRFGKEVTLIPVEKRLIEDIQRLSINSEEIYCDQPIEDFVHNILNSERIRLMDEEKKREKKAN